eukprot:631276-Pleurochrysis_carterae.AAC.2
MPSQNGRESRELIVKAWLASETFVAMSSRAGEAGGASSSAAASDAASVAWRENTSRQQLLRACSAM